jgi:hypothetical protein
MSPNGLREQQETKKAKTVHTKDVEIQTLEEIFSGLKQKKDPSTSTFSK